MHTNSAAQRRTRHFGIMAAAFLGLASMKPLYTPIIFFANQTIAMISILSENGWALRLDDKQQKRNARFEAGKWWFVLCLFSFCFCVIWDRQACHLCGQIGCPSIRGDNRHLLPTHPPPHILRSSEFPEFQIFSCQLFGFTSWTKSDPPSRFCPQTMLWHYMLYLLSAYSGLHDNPTNCCPVKNYGCQKLLS